MVISERVLVPIALQMPITNAPVYIFHGVLGIAPKAFDVLKVARRSIGAVLDVLALLRAYTVSWS